MEGLDQQVQNNIPDINEITYQIIHRQGNITQKQLCILANLVKLYNFGMYNNLDINNTIVNILMIQGFKDKPSFNWN